MTKTSLFIDTSYAGYVVAIRHGDQVFQCHNPSLRDQASFLIPSIEDLLNKNDIKKQTLDNVVVSAGPGSFTGIRIGISAAKAIAKGLGISLFGMNVFNVLKNQIDHKERAFAVLIETHRSDYYVGVYDKTKNLMADISAVESKDLEKLLNDNDITDLYGNAVDRFMEEMAEKKSTFNSQIIEFLDINADLFDDNSSFLDNVSPIYLRGADVSVSKKKKKVLLQQ